MRAGDRTLHRAFPLSVERSLSRNRAFFAQFWGAHACGVLVSAFCGDELLPALLESEHSGSSLPQNVAARTLQACAPQKKLTCAALRRRRSVGVRASRLVTSVFTATERR